MSKSLGNYIGVDEPPNEIYGKVMSLVDDVLIQYFDLLTDVSDKELEEFRQQLASNSVNPMELKKRLARELITQLYNEEEAAEADDNFTKVFQKRGLPEGVGEFEVGAEEDIRDIITRANLAKSHSEANRLLQQGAISINGVRVSAGKISYQSGNIIKVGKHHFIKVVVRNK
jgi:tyrosyl-tRNA synthetase